MYNKDLLQLHNDFIREKRLAKKSEQTLKSYKINFNVFYNFPTYKKLEEINKSTILDFLEYLNSRKRIIGKGDEVSGVSANTIITYRNRLSPFFDWLKKYEHIKQNPFSDIELPKKEDNDKEMILHRDKIERIFTTINLSIDWCSNFLKKRNSAIFSVLLYAGVRKGELLALKVSDIDFDNKTITINASTSKSRKNRKIPMSDRLFLVLEDYLNCRRSFDNPYLFISERGGQFKINGLKKLIEKIKKTLKFSFHLHQFRHTFAVNVLNKTGDIYLAQKLLGHQRITTTAIYLTYIPESKKREAVNALNFEDLI